MYAQARMAARTIRPRTPTHPLELDGLDRAGQYFEHGGGCVDRLRAPAKRGGYGKRRGPQGPVTRAQGTRGQPKPLPNRLAHIHSSSKQQMDDGCDEGPHVQVARRKDGDAVVGEGGRGGNHDHSRHVLLYRPRDPQTSQVITSRSDIPQRPWSKSKWLQRSTRTVPRWTKTGQTRHTPPQGRQCTQHRTYPGSVYPADTV